MGMGIVIHIVSQSNKLCEWVGSSQAVSAGSHFFDNVIQYMFSAMGTVRCHLKASSASAERDYKRRTIKAGVTCRDTQVEAKSCKKLKNKKKEENVQSFHVSQLKKRSLNWTKRQEILSITSEDDALESIPQN